MITYHDFIQLVILFQMKKETKQEEECLTLVLQF